MQNPKQISNERATTALHTMQDHLQHTTVVAQQRSQKILSARSTYKNVDRTPTHNTHLCSTVCSQARNASHALGSRLHNIFVRLKRICHLVRTCLTLCCSLTCRLPRAHHLLHSLFLLPRHQNTHYNQDNTISSKNTQYIMHISMLSKSTSSAIKNHSGVKTCRVAETSARQLPQRTKGKAAYEPLEVLTQAREGQEAARRLDEQKCEEAAEAGTMFNGTMKVHLRKLKRSKTRKRR